MPVPTKASPNTGNYQVGKGIVSFQPSGTSGFRDLGNVEAMSLSPKMTTLDHFSSRAGVKAKDYSIVLEKTSTVKITMDEVTADNIGLMLLGTVDDTAVGGPTVEIFDQSAVTGWLKFVGQNDIGAQVTMDLYNVSFSPSGDFTLISDEWNKMEASADVLVAGIIPAISAKAVYTATSIADTDTVTIDSVVYTWQTTLTAGAGHVKRTGVVATDLATLVKAINLTGISGTDYGAGTVIHPTVSAVSDSTTLTVTAKVGGVGGNTLAVSKTGTGESWGASTLLGGLASDATKVGKFGHIQLTNVTS